LRKKNPSTPPETEHCMVSGKETTVIKVTTITAYKDYKDIPEKDYVNTQM
jgi:hypothetical protein